MSDIEQKDEYYRSIMAKAMALAAERYPATDKDLIVWARREAPDLADEENRLQEELNGAWQNAPLDAFKKTARAYFKVVLKIYERYHEAQKEEKGTKSV